MPVPSFFLFSEWNIDVSSSGRGETRPEVSHVGQAWSLARARVDLSSKWVSRWCLNQRWAQTGSLEGHRISS